MMKVERGGEAHLGQISVREHHLLQIREAAQVARGGAHPHLLTQLAQARVHRGFAVAMDDAGKTLASRDDFSEGMHFTLRLGDGAVGAVAAAHDGAR